MRSLNFKGAFVFAVLFLTLAYAGSLCFPSDTNVYFSAESGFYDDPVLLEMTCAVPGVDIYYTTDGSVPTARSYYYDAPLVLENVEDEYHTLSDYTGISDADYVPLDSMMKANVVRAAAFRGENRISNVCSGTYFVGIDRQEEYGDVPILSLMMDEDDLFDYEKGIYTLGETFDKWYAYQEEPVNLSHLMGNFDRKGKEWERLAYVEYLSSDGRVGFSQQLGVRIKGGTTRRNMQKSLRLTARKEYGSSRINHALFDEVAMPYKCFVLRNGGNDYANAKIREPLVHNLAQGMRVDTQRSMPCVAFINGEYWGLYTITEEYDDCYIEARYGLDRAQAVMIKRGNIEEGEERDRVLFDEMVDFIVENDMSVEENYQKASRMLYIGSFVDYVAIQSYINNHESFLKMDNNWMMWRTRVLDSSNPYADTRWRMMFFDADRSSYAGDDGSGAFADNLEEALFSPLAGDESDLLYVLRALYENALFRRELITALCDVRNIYFERGRALEETAVLRQEYEPLMPDNVCRFGPQWMLETDLEETIGSELDEVALYFDIRYEAFPEIVQNALGLQAPAELTLHVSGDGSVMVNHSVPDTQEGYTGLYFPDYPITLTAQETGAGRFVRWEYEDCTLSDPASPVTEVSFEGDFSVRAVFE